VDLCDTFDSNENNWVTGIEDDEWGTRTASITGGNFYWQWSARKDVVSRNTYSASSYGDMELTTRVKRVSGSTETSCYGLSFRGNELGTYWWAVCDNQEFSVSRIPADGSDWIPVVEGTMSSAVRTSSKSQLSVVAHGSDFRLYVNGYLVSSFHDPTLESGEVGYGVVLAPSDSASFEFDYFVVRVP
jgi:hypothetical protein